MQLLIVADDPDICVMLRAVLTSEGWDTEEVMSGEDALRRIDGHADFDAVVLDYRMPGLSGIDVARRLRDDGITQPMIMCSAYLSPEVEQDARQLGVPTVDKADLALLVELVRASLRSDG